MGFAAEIIHFSVKISKKCGVNQNPLMLISDNLGECPTITHKTTSPESLSSKQSTLTSS